MTDWKTKLPEWWDKLAALFGAALLFLNALIGLNIWGDTAQRWISVAIGGLTAAAIWFKRNVNVAERITGIDIDQNHDIGVEKGTQPENKPIDDLIERVKPPTKPDGSP